MWCILVIVLSYAVGFVTVPVWILVKLYRALSKDHVK